MTMNRIHLHCPKARRARLPTLAFQAKRKDSIGLVASDSRCITFSAAIVLFDAKAILNLESSLDCQFVAALILGMAAVTAHNRKTYLMPN